MWCPFVIKSRNGLCCEVLESMYGGRQQIFSRFLCEKAWESLCPYYYDVANGTENDPSITAGTKDPTLCLGHVGHINRIGGHRTLFQDLM
jgi:hypothetical protein